VNREARNNRHAGSLLRGNGGRTHRTAWRDNLTRMEPLESRRFQVVGSKDNIQVHAAGTDSFAEARAIGRSYKDDGCAVNIRDTASQPAKEYSLDSDGVAHELDPRRGNAVSI